MWSVCGVFTDKLLLYFTTCEILTIDAKSFKSKSIIIALERNTRVFKPGEYLAFSCEKLGLGPTCSQAKL